MPRLVQQQRHGPRVSTASVLAKLKAEQTQWRAERRKRQQARYRAKTSRRHNPEVATTATRVSPLSSSFPTQRHVTHSPFASTYARTYSSCATRARMCVKRSAETSLSHSWPVSHTRRHDVFVAVIDAKHDIVARAPMSRWPWLVCRRSHTLLSDSDAGARSMRCAV